MNDDPTEALCRRCGRCCYAKVLIEDEVYYTDLPCPFLDLETNLCRIYPNRFELNPDCLALEDGIRLGVFPSDCPYVKDIPAYRGPHTDCDRAEMRRLFREAE